MAKAKEILLLIIIAIIVFIVIFNIRINMDKGNCDKYYTFSSRVEYDNSYIESTKPILLPDELSKKSSYTVQNTTEYSILLHTQEYGLLKIEQGTTEIECNPISFFILKPDNSENDFRSGELVIVGDTGGSGKYRITGEGDKENCLEVEYKKIKK